MIPPKDLESPVDESLLPPSPGDRIVGNTKVVQPDDLLIANIRATPDEKATLPPSGFENPSIYCYRNALLSVLLCSDRLMSYIQHHHLPRIDEYQHGFISEGKSRLPPDYQDVFTMMHRLFQCYWSSSRDQESVDEAMREFWEYIDTAHRPFEVKKRWPMGSQEDCSELLNFLISVLNLQLGEDTSAVQSREVQNVQHLMYSATQVLRRCAGCRLDKNVKHAVRSDDSLIWQVPILAEGTLRLEDFVFQDYGTELTDSPWYCNACYTSWEDNVKPKYTPGTPAYKEMIAKYYAKNKSDYEWHNVARLPEVLLMQLKVFDRDSDKLDVQIRLVRELDMAEYVNKDVCKGSTRYRLKGIVRHIGTNLSFGHYISEVMVADQWYCINDENVRKTTWLEINNVKRQKGSSPETPYLLLWEKVPEPEDEEGVHQEGTPSSGRVSSPIKISSSENSSSHSSPIEKSSSKSSSSRSSTRQGSESKESGGHGAGGQGSNSDESVKGGSDNDDTEEDSLFGDFPSDDISDNEGSANEASNNEASDNDGSDKADSDSDSPGDPDPGPTPANTVFVADAGTQTLSKLHDAPAAIRSSINFDGQSLLEIHPIPNLPDFMERIYAAPEGGERPSNAIDVKHRGRLEVFQMEDGHPPVSFQLWKVLRRGYLHWEDIIDKDEFGKKQKQAWYNFYNNVHTSYGPGIHPVEMIPKWQWKQREADRKKNEYWARIAEEQKTEQQKGKGKGKNKIEEPKVRKISIFQTPMVQWVTPDKKPTGKSKKPKSPPRKLTLKQPYQNAATSPKTPSPTTPRPRYTTRGTSPKTPSPKTPSPKMPSPKLPSPKTLRPEYKNEQTQVYPTDIDVSDDDQSSSSYVTAPSLAKSDSKSPSPRQSPTGPGASSSPLSSPPASSSSLSSPPESPAPAPKRRGRPSKAATQPTRVMPERKVKLEHPGLVGDTAMKGASKTTAPKKPAAGKKGAKKPGTGGRKGVGKKTPVRTTPVKKVPVVSDDTDSESDITKKPTKKRKRADVEEESEVAKKADDGKDDEEGRSGRKRLKKNEDGTWSRD